MFIVPLWYAVSLFFVLGACVGSFYNVVIYRMPRGLSLIKPASFCPTCNKHIPIYHNLPILAWLFLRGKSACCGNRISIQYPLVELLCALLGALSVILAEWPLSFEAPWTQITNSFALFWLLLAIVPVCAVDFKHHLIPDSISIGGVVVGLLLSLIPGGISTVESLVGVLIAGVGLYGLGLLMTFLLKKEAMGFGDVKLLAGYGAFMGWFYAFEVLIFAAFLGLLVMLPLKFFKKIKGSEAENTSFGEIPFGPFLSIMAPIVYLWGDKILKVYLSFVY
jgi:leader peptidase (prepilin peptidase)/N-methyltransferase